MSRPGIREDKPSDTARDLAVGDLQLLLAVEPHLAEAFRALAKRCENRELRTFCKEGVRYTLKRAPAQDGVPGARRPAVPRASPGLGGLIKDAKRAAGRTRSTKTDIAILAAIERISHFGLAIYTTIDRYLRLASAPKARRALIPSTKEKREAIGEMSRMMRSRLLPRLRQMSHQGRASRQPDVRE
jgi:hypothetical protein